MAMPIPPASGPPAQEAPARKDGLWRYGLSAVLVLAGGLVLNVGLLALYSAAGWSGMAALLGDHGTGDDTLFVRLGAFTYLMASIIVFLPVMRIVLPVVHGRPWGTFLSAAPRWRWRRFARSLAIMMALLLVLLAVQLLAFPGSLKFDARWKEIAVFAIVGAALVPLQVLSEEIFFRGFLAQMMARATALAAIQIAVPAALFTAAHWQNPETQQGEVWALAIYATAGLYLGLIAWLDRGIESAAGAHLAINTFAILIVGSAVSVSPSSVIWRESAPDYRANFIAGVALFAVHFALMFRRRFMWRAQRGRP